MKVLHLAPLWFPVAPDAPGGIETLLARLLLALGRIGCECTLLAAGDSRPDVTLEPVVDKNLVGMMAAGSAGEYVYYEQRQLILALGLAERFDVVHSHIGPAAYSLSAHRGFGARVLHTQHNPVYQDLEWFVGQHPDTWFSTVSEAQAIKLRSAGATRCRVVHNGIDVDAFDFSADPEPRLFYIGRMEHEKGPDLAIDAAEAAGMPLTLAGPIIDQRYFDSCILPRLSARVEYVGVVDHAVKNGLYGRSACLLVPSRCEEGFGMVAVEAMACGTPAVALANGALAEVVEHGRTGFFTKDATELPRLVTSAMELDRAAIRSRAAERFDIHVTAAGYLKLYQDIVEGAGRGPRR